jgi:radical SAM superfamily enzyme YgiQ (UPF0313 family)
MKKVVIYIPDATSQIYLPLFWASAKSYYEINGKRTDEYEWVHPRINYEFNNDKLKTHLLEVQPDVFGISMYIWNDVQCLEIAQWVRETFPNCLIISGGPQQYFKHDMGWFEKYSFLDASLDGGEYGELTIADILDNLDDNNKVNWNLVREVVYPSKNRKTILKSIKTSSKLDFFWDYSPYKLQRDIILECSREIKALPNPANYSDASSITMVMGKVETTRGCPYSCQFCDWGGGIGSKVIKKPVDKVKDDLDVLEEAGCSFVFLCDANFGILGDRDLSIIKYIASRKKNNPEFFHLYFGGFAKSDKHTEIIKQILDIDARYNLTWDLSYKASIQSIHQDVLDNIKRSDISFEKHVYLANFLKDNYNFSSYAECISGLPGITPDKWYQELNVFASHDMDVCLYHWSLLPETPSYAKEFRERMGIKTVNKSNNMQSTNSTLRKSEVVVESFSYTKDDYKEMWIAYSIQRAFWSTGLLDNTINKILKTSNIGYGDFIKLFYTDFLRGKPGAVFEEHMSRLDLRFSQYYDPDSDVSNLSISFPNATANMNSSFMLMLFYNFEECRDDLKDWLLSKFEYLNPRQVDRELDLFITINNVYTTSFNKTRFIRYGNPVINRFKNDKNKISLIDSLVTQMETYTQTKFLTAGVIGI